jgi:hypothetical protein
LCVSHRRTDDHTGQQHPGAKPRNQRRAGCVQLACTQGWRRGVRSFQPGGGLAWMRTMRSGPGLAAALGMAAAAAAGCVGTGRPPRRIQTAVISRSGGRARPGRAGPRSPSPTPPPRLRSQCCLAVTLLSPCRAGAGARPPTCTRPATGSCENNAPSCSPWQAHDLPSSQTRQHSARCDGETREQPDDASLGRHGDPPRRPRLGTRRQVQAGRARATRTSSSAHPKPRRGRPRSPSRTAGPGATFLRMLVTERDPPMRSVACPDLNNPPARAVG